MNNNDEMNLKDFILKSRTELGLTQFQLAKSANITQSSLARIEAGAVQQVRASTLAKIAKALKVPLVRLTDMQTNDSTLPSYKGPQITLAEQQLLDDLRQAGIDPIKLRTAVILIPESILDVLAAFDHIRDSVPKFLPEPRMLEKQEQLKQAKKLK